MEDVLKGNKDIKGFIDQKGILIRVANVNLGEDPVEIIAESIVRNVEKCTVLEQKMKAVLDTNDNVYQKYLIDYYCYIYIHLHYGEESVEIKELKSPRNPNDVTDLQKNRIQKLCKNGATSVELPKVLEIGGK